MEAFLKEIENLRILPRKKIIKGGKGNYKGTGSGSSLDFYGHRKYIPGDDIRKIDWKAYMRTGDFFIREFTEEKEMHINVILDNSASMNFGNPNKWETAKMLAIGVGYLTLKHMDNLSLYYFNDQLSEVQTNIRGKENFYKLLQIVSELESQGVTDYNAILDIDIQQQGIFFIISDLMGEEIIKVLDFLCAKGQEAVLIHVLAPFELEPNNDGELKLIDNETGEIRRIYLNSTTKEIYLNKIKNFIERYKTACTNREVKYLLAPTDIAPAKILAKVLGG